MSSLDDDLNTLRIYSSGLSPMEDEEDEEDEELTLEAANVEELPAPDEETPAEVAIEPINLPALADRIYSLLKQELRLERERLARNTPW